MRALCQRHYPNDSVEQRKTNYRSLLAWMKAIRIHSKDGIIPTLATFEHGVFCTSEVNNDILMWSHYARQHTGVCVAIRPDRLTGKRILPVEYRDDVPIIDAWIYTRPRIDVFVDVSRAKSSHWKYEKEWRTIDTLGQHQFAGCVDQVIIGAMADAATRREIAEAVAATQVPIEILEAQLSESRYRVDIPKVADKER